MRLHSYFYFYNNRVIKNAIVEINFTISIVNSTVTWNLTIEFLLQIKPKPAWALTQKAFYSRPGWRYLCIMALMQRGQTDSTFGIP